MLRRQQFLDRRYWMASRRDRGNTQQPMFSQNDIPIREPLPSSNNKAWHVDFPHDLISVKVDMKPQVLIVSQLRFIEEPVHNAPALFLCGPQSSISCVSGLADEPYHGPVLDAWSCDKMRRGYVRAPKLYFMRDEDNAGDTARSVELAAPGNLVAQSVQDVYLVALVRADHRVLGT